MARALAYSLFIVLTGIFLFLSATITTEADTGSFSITEPPDNTAVEGELISIAVKLKDTAIDAINILVNGYNALPEKHPDFSAEEFSNGSSVKSLLKEIENDDFEIEFTTPDSTLDRLNELLRVSGFYDMCVRKDKAIKFDSRDQQLVPETESYRNKDFQKLSSEQQKKILKLNRLLLEAIYPKTCPKKNYQMAAVTGKKYFCKTVTLDYGPNEIEVVAMKNGNITGSAKIHSFYRADLSKDFNVTPAKFSKKEFHNNDREKECGTCHRLKTADIDNAPVKITDSSCYSCHKNITAYANVHGPAATWNCLNCHDKKTGTLKYQTQKPDKDLCFTCHYEKKDDWASKKYAHGPTATGKCTICHNPHASNNIYWLKKSPWNLCTTCHEERGSGRHVLAGVGGSGTGHPMKDRPDPLHAGHEFSCNSCHNPHASNSPSLFAHEALSVFGLCQMCHKK